MSLTSASPRAADKRRALTSAVGRSEKSQDFPVHGFGCFLSIFLGQISSSFSIQFYPTKILFREMKSDRNIPEKYKDHEIFISCFSVANR